ncbi:leucine-rich repeat protein [Perkinsela sp. CCAP 1560/4]|nr:leucine-rich repeat protein [Perkinsela sp. CCAP 1560/4]|eukprot:KNH05155.1 leucine-rich repeat protein [Perkinsela sp. CCAP 1560/4]
MPHIERPRDLDLTQIHTLDAVWHHAHLDCPFELVVTQEKHPYGTREDAHIDGPSEHLVSQPNALEPQGKPLERNIFTAEVDIIVVMLPVDFNYLFIWIENDAWPLFLIFYMLSGIR